MKVTKEEIIEKIAELFSDTSVSQSATLEALEEIREEIDFKIDAIKADFDKRIKS